MSSLALARRTSSLDLELGVAMAKLLPSAVLTVVVTITTRGGPP
jgi:hypothetical protein